MNNNNVSWFKQLVIVKFELKTSTPRFDMQEWHKKKRSFRLIHFIFMFSMNHLSWMTLSPFRMLTPWYQLFFFFFKNIHSSKCSGKHLFIQPYPRILKNNKRDVKFDNINSGERINEHLRLSVLRIGQVHNTTLKSNEEVAFSWWANEETNKFTFSLPELNVE